MNFDIAGSQPKLIEYFVVVTIHLNCIHQFVLLHIFKDDFGLV